MDWKSVNKTLLKKTLSFILSISFILTFIVLYKYHLLDLNAESKLIIFLIFTFLISMPIYLVFYRKNFHIKILILCASLLAICTPIFLAYTLPVITNNLDSDIIDNTDDKIIDDIDISDTENTNQNTTEDTNNNDTISEPTLEEYIGENIKGVIYSEYAGINWGTRMIMEKFIIYIFNKGDKNIDEDLQLSISFSLNYSCLLSKPDDIYNMSFTSNTTKPWVFGENKITYVRWNKSLPITTLPSNGNKWAIIYLNSPDLGGGFFDYRQSITYSAIINDIYPIDVNKMPIFVKPPSGNPKDWDIAEVLSDIEHYG